MVYVYPNVIIKINPLAEAIARVSPDTMRELLRHQDPQTLDWVWHFWVQIAHARLGPQDQNWHGHWDWLKNDASLYDITMAIGGYERDNYSRVMQIMAIVRNCPPLNAKTVPERLRERARLRGYWLWADRPERTRDPVDRRYILMSLEGSHLPGRDSAQRFSEEEIWAQLGGAA